MTTFDETGLAEIFYRLQNQLDTPQGRRIESLLNLLALLGNAKLDRADKATALTRLRTALGRYRWVIQIAHSKQGLHAFYVPSRDSSPDELWEYAAVNMLLELLRHDGALSRLRRCATCEGWLFALRRSDQKFCGNGKACRQYAHDNDPAKKASRLARLRKNYAEAKARAKNPKSGVGLRTRSTTKARTGKESR